MYIPKEELKLQEKALRAIRKKRVLVWNISSTNMSNFPDLLLNINGRFVGIELKDSPKAEARQGQVNTLTKLYEHGSFVMIAWTVEQVEQFIDDVRVGSEDLREYYYKEYVLPFKKELKYE